MVNQEHLDLLKQGTAIWNRWREEHPDITPDLKDGHLASLSLKEINFSFADLSFADLSFTDLSFADLRGANLFFFSSRRRHTRYIGDWSSDVCSSDLVHST